MRLRELAWAMRQGKRDPVWCLPCGVLIVRDGKLPGGDIESGAQIVGNVADDCSDARWRRRIREELRFDSARFGVVQHLCRERRSRAQILLALQRQGREVLSPARQLGPGVSEREKQWVLRSRRYPFLGGVEASQAVARKLGVIARLGSRIICTARSADSNAVAPVCWLSFPRSWRRCCSYADRSCRDGTGVTKGRARSNGKHEPLGIDPRGSFRVSGAGHRSAPRGSFG